MRVHRDRLAPAELADASRFTGRVWRTEYIDPVADDGLGGLRFTYEPGARSYWHVHECEQAIVCVSGTGLVAWRGDDESLHLFGPGDWWHVTPGVPHWHGAIPTSPFAHLAVTAGAGTRWLEEVPDTDYAAAAARVAGA